MPLGHFAVVLGSSSGFCPKAIFRNLKDEPRDAPDLGQSHFRRIARMDLGLLADLPQGHFRHPSRRTSGSLNVVSAFGDPSGCAKRQTLFWHNFRTDLGVVLKAVGAFRTTSRRISGVSKRWMPLWTLQGRPRGTFPQIGILSPPSRQTSGVTKSRRGVSLPLLQTYLGGPQSVLPRLGTSRRTSGWSFFRIPDF